MFIINDKTSSQFHYSHISGDAPLFAATLDGATQFQTRELADNTAGQLTDIYGLELTVEELPAKG